MKYRLVMKRGKKIVVIGEFPSIYRARVVAVHMEWEPAWAAIIEKI